MENSIQPSKPSASLNRASSSARLSSRDSSVSDQLSTAENKDVLKSYGINVDSIKIIQEATQFFPKSIGNIEVISYVQARNDMHNGNSDLGLIGTAVQEKIIQLRTDTSPKLKVNEMLEIDHKYFSGQVKKSETGDVVFVSGRVNNKDVNMIFPGDIFDSRTALLS